jgi:hypothetical protein
VLRKAMSDTLSVHVKAGNMYFTLLNIARLSRAKSLGSVYHPSGMLASLDTSGDEVGARDNVVSHGKCCSVVLLDLVGEIVAPRFLYLAR